MRTRCSTCTLKGFPLIRAVINRLFLTLSVLDGEMHLGTDSCFAPASGRRFPKALIIIPQALSSTEAPSDPDFNRRRFKTLRDVQHGGQHKCSF